MSFENLSMYSLSLFYDWLEYESDTYNLYINKKLDFEFKLQALVQTSIHVHSILDNIDSERSKLLR